MTTAATHNLTDIPQPGRVTTIINLWAGSGAGKSTTAADVFTRMKRAHVSCELVTEYVKSWAWRGEPVREWDDVYLFAKQLRRESACYGKVDYIVTDSPLGLSAVYERKYKGSDVHFMARLATDMRARQHLSGVLRHVDCFLLRTKPYSTAGRYETEAQAREVDGFVREWLQAQGEYHCVQDASDVLRAAGVVP